MRIPTVHRTESMPEKQLSMDEIDTILKDLEKSLDVTTPGEGVSILEVTNGSNAPPVADNCLLRFECPSAIWEEFVDYCKRNELDPAQQIKEAILAYYKNLWQTYRIRRKLNDDSRLV